jgi:protein-L-isoaspartate(D-aspartate) O-methyltransferase
MRTRSILCSAAIVILALGGSGAAQHDSSGVYARRRARMVERQIEARGITDSAVCAAMASVPRHRFVPPEHRHLAYRDHPLPIGEGQTISQPSIVGLMSRTLALDSTKRILEIGTGSGYQAAVAAQICAHVYTIEIVESLGERARRLLRELGYDNVTVKIGDGYQGWKEQAPFDGIIVTCAPSHIPRPLQEQLAEGGRMVIPVGEAGEQELVLLRKREGTIHREKIIPVRFVPMMSDSGTAY